MSELECWIPKALVSMLVLYCWKLHACFGSGKEQQCQGITESPWEEGSEGDRVR